MKQAKVPGKIADYIFTPNNHKNLENVMTAYNNKEVIMTISRPSKKRTNPQNSYLWGVVYKMIADETGSDDESVHHHLTDMFLKDSGGTIPKVGSTTKLSTIEFSEYIDKIIRWSAEFLSMYIPLPGEQEMWGSYDRQ